MKFLEICFMKHLKGEDTFFSTKINYKNVYFLLQNRYLKSKIECKNNGKLKLQTFFSRNYEFAFTNLLKMRQNYSTKRVNDTFISDLCGLTILT
jgi:hypothetical protein